MKGASKVALNSKTPLEVWRAAKADGDWGGPVTLVAEVVTGGQIVAVCELVDGMLNKHAPGRTDIDVRDVLLRAWAYVLRQGIYDLQCFAGSVEDDAIHEIVFGARP